MTFGTEWGWGCDKDTARQMFNTYADPASPNASGNGRNGKLDCHSTGRWVGNCGSHQTITEVP